MVIYATKLIHLPILDPDSHQRLGEVAHCIFDPDRGTLAALEIKQSGILGHGRYATFGDIVSFERHGVLCQSDALLPLEELPKIDALRKEHRPILNQQATHAGGRLGKVEEVAFDLLTGHITQIHTHFLFKRRIFSYRDIEKVTRDAVVIRHDAAQAVDEEPIPEAVPETV